MSPQYHRSRNKLPSRREQNGKSKDTIERGYDTCSLGEALPVPSCLERRNWMIRARPSVMSNVIWSPSSLPLLLRSSRSALLCQLSLLLEWIWRTYFRLIHTYLAINTLNKYKFSIFLVFLITAQLTRQLFYCPCWQNQPQKFDICNCDCWLCVHHLLISLRFGCYNTFHVTTELTLQHPDNSCLHDISGLQVLPIASLPTPAV